MDKKFNVLEDNTEQHILKCLILRMSCPEIMENFDVLFDDIYNEDMNKVYTGSFIKNFFF